MKKILAVALLAFFGSTLYAGNVNDVSDKVLKAFKSTFTNAQDVKWTEYDNNYCVSFSLDGIQSKVIYDKEGNMVSSLRYYSPERLPMNIYTKLKNRFTNRTLFGVTESTSDHDVLYYVKMYDAKNWYTLKVDSEGSMEQVEKMKRADQNTLSTDKAGL